MNPNRDKLLGLSFPCAGVLDEGVFDLGLEDEEVLPDSRRRQSFREWSDAMVPQGPEVDTPEILHSPDSLDIAILGEPLGTVRPGQGGDSTLTMSPDHPKPPRVNLRELLVDDVTISQRTPPQPGDSLDSFDQMPAFSESLSLSAAGQRNLCPPDKVRARVEGVTQHLKDGQTICGKSDITNHARNCNIAVRTRCLRKAVSLQSDGKSCEATGLECSTSLVDSGLGLARRRCAEAEKWAGVSWCDARVPGDVFSSPLDEHAPHSDPTNRPGTSGSGHAANISNLNSTIPMERAKVGKKIGATTLAPDRQPVVQSIVSSQRTTTAARRGGEHNRLRIEATPYPEAPQGGLLGFGLRAEEEAQETADSAEDELTPHTHDDEDLISSTSGLQSTVAGQLKSVNELLKRRNFFYVDTTYKTRRLPSLRVDRGRRKTRGIVQGMDSTAGRGSGPGGHRHGVTNFAVHLQGSWSSVVSRRQTVGLHTIPGEKVHDPGWKSQDAMLALAPFKQKPGNEDKALFAVFDGHGPNGRQVARECMQRLPRHLCSGSGRGGVSQAFRRTCQILHREISAGIAGDCSHSGTTLCAVLLGGGQLTIANVGDSRCCRVRQLPVPVTPDKGIHSFYGGEDQVLSEVEEVDMATRGVRMGGRQESGVSLRLSSDPPAATRLVAEWLTCDHKPHRIDELTRIQANGGVVLPLPTAMDTSQDISTGVLGLGAQGIQEDISTGFLEPSRDHANMVPRVWLPSGQGPGLAMSRSIGDKVAHSVGVSYEPDVTEIELDAATDTMLILATDGVWDVVSLEDIRRMVLPHLSAGRWSPSSLSEEICQHALNGWGTIGHGGSDDISCLVVKTSEVLKAALPVTQAKKIACAQGLTAETSKRTGGDTAVITKALEFSGGTKGNSIANPSEVGG